MLRSLRVPLVVVLVLWTLAPAVHSAVRPAAVERAGPGGFVWQPMLSYTKAYLRITGKQGVLFEHAFAPGETLAYRLTYAYGVLPDGDYTYELRFQTPPDPNLLSLYEDARNRGDREAMRSIKAMGRAARAGQADHLSNRFRVEGGRLATESLGKRTSALDEPPQGEPEGDTHHVGTVTATGNACFGDAECSSGYSPGDDLEVLDGGGVSVIRLMDDSTQVDRTVWWEIQTGASIFQIDDQLTGTRPFAIEETAPTDSLYIASSGDIGMGTSTPAAGLDMVRGSGDPDPVVRLSAFNSFWSDNGSFELIYDPDAESGGVTGALKIMSTESFSNPSFTNVPVIISEDAADNTLYVAASTRVGIGTDAPSDTLHVVGSALVEGDVSLGSSRLIKKDLEPVSGGELLSSLMELPLWNWSYREDSREARHVGPMAEDFYALFGLGRDERHISPIDAAGVALAAIQGLFQEIRDRDETIASLVERNEQIEGELTEVKETLEALTRRREVGEPPGD